MKKLLLLFGILVLFGVPVEVAIADSSATAEGNATSILNSSPNQSFSINSEGQKRTPNMVQDLGFMYPPSLFVNATDWRNVMNLLRFIYEHPCPTRAELEAWAAGGDSEIIISSTNKETDWNNRSPHDRIAFSLDITFPAVVVHPGYIEYKPAHKGMAVANVKDARMTISLQNLSKLALRSMDYNHNIFEITATIVAETMETTGYGAAVGGGFSNLSGNNNFTIPAILGWARGKGGKVALEGIQGNLYYLPAIIFDDEAKKTKKQIEGIWNGQKKDRESTQLDKDIKDLERKLKKKELEKRLQDSDRPSPPPPVVKRELAPTPAPAPAPAPTAPSDGEKKMLEEMVGKMNEDNKKLQEENDRLAKELAVRIPGNVCPIAIFFDRDKFVVKKSEEAKLKQLAEWLAAPENKDIRELAKAGRVQFQWVGECDDTPGLSRYLDRINPWLGLQRAMMVHTLTTKLLREAGFTQAELDGFAKVSASNLEENLPVPKPANEQDKAKNRRVILRVVIGPVSK